MRKIQIKPAYFINSLLCFNALSGLIWVGILPIPLGLQILFTAIIGIGCYHYYYYHYRRRMMVITLPRLFDNTKNALWQVRTADEKTWQAVLKGQRTLSSQWILVRLCLSLLAQENTERYIYLVLHASQVSPLDWHYLTVICRSTPAVL